VFTWCAELKSDKKAIGRIDLGGFVKKSMADISYYFSPEYWGMGYATEAVKEVTRFGFDELRLHRIQADWKDENVPGEFTLFAIKNAKFIISLILNFWIGDFCCLNNILKFLLTLTFRDSVVLFTAKKHRIAAGR
jgi:ribosomal-protein-alanine N-acetyltransferase